MSRILLIEDNESNRDLVSRYLQLFGHEVVLAENGEDALARVRSDPGKIDVILMDISLPVLDGCEVTRMLKFQESTRNVPVIAISAHAMVGDREKALQAGCSDYVTKPVDFQVLLSKIESLTAKAHQE